MALHFHLLLGIKFSGHPTTPMIQFLLYIYSSYFRGRKQFMMPEEWSTGGNGDVKHFVANIVRVSGTTVNSTTLVVCLYVNACMCVNAHIYTYMDEYPHIHRFTYTYSHTYIYICACICENTHASFLKKNKPKPNQNPKTNITICSWLWVEILFSDLLHYFPYNLVVWLDAVIQSKI